MASQLRLAPASSPRGRFRPRAHACPDPFALPRAITVPHHALSLTNAGLSTPARTIAVQPVSTFFWR